MPAAEQKPPTPEIRAVAPRAVGSTAERTHRVSPALIMPSCWFNLASKDGVADGGVEQHQREDEQTLAPEHEGKARMRRGSLVDRDRERDHVGPERDRQGAKRRQEDQCGRVERPSVPAAADAGGQHERGQRTDRRKNEQIRPVDPSVHQRKIFDQGVYEDDGQEHEHAGREIGYLSPRRVPDISVTLVDQPAGAEQRIAETQADTTEHGKRTEPAEIAADILAIRDRQPLDEGADGHSLDERRRNGSTNEAPIPEPARPLRLVAKLKCHSAQDQPSQHDKKGQIKRGKQRRINYREGTPQDDTSHHEPRLIAVPNR